MERELKLLPEELSSERKLQIIPERIKKELEIMEAWNHQFSNGEKNALSSNSNKKLFGIRSSNAKRFAKKIWH